MPTIPRLMNKMRILVTGSKGFIGQNLVLKLSENSEFEIITYDRDDTRKFLDKSIAESDAIIHLAGVNRSDRIEDFDRGNVALTKDICDSIEKSGRKVPLILASSTQAALDNPYGLSKRAAELAVETLNSRTANPVAIYRLPGVFGKWCKPHYNSVVATFCHNCANDLPIQVSDLDREISLVYIDDVVATMSSDILNVSNGLGYKDVSPVYRLTLGELAELIESFRGCRENLVIPPVGTGILRALYSTYVSYLPSSKFSYGLVSHGDERGTFVEMLKTEDSGQFSYFTAHPGVTRGGHYHHTKTEKFLVIKGSAKYRFRNLASGELVEIDSTGEKPTVVETIPGWTHDITNVGNDELIVMLWANEIFDREKPDTINSEV